jgi:alkaline phosphatase D
MVDLVTAGISSDSFFSYLRDAAQRWAISARWCLPAGGAGDGPGHLNLSFNLLDYTMGKAAPTLASLLEQTRVQLRGGAGGERRAGSAAGSDRERRAGRPASQQRLQHQPAGLAQQLSGLGNNQWLKHLNTDAQGYTLVTLTPEK